MPRVRKGLFITLSKYENAGLVGARRMALESLSGKTLAPYVPPKIYLLVEKGGVDKFCGLDLLTRLTHWFKYQSGKWYEFDPKRPEALFDAWGWVNLAPLPTHQARTLMQEQLHKRAESARTARKERADYQRFREIVLEKAA